MHFPHITHFLVDFFVNSRYTLIVFVYFMFTFEQGRKRPNIVVIKLSGMSLIIIINFIKERYKRIVSKFKSIKLIKFKI